MINNILQYKPAFDGYDYPSAINALVDALQIAAEDPAFPWSYAPATTSGLVFGYLGGTLQIDGAATTITAGTLNLTSNATHYIEATRAGAISANTAAFTPGRLPLYTVATGLTAINTVTDLRQFNRDFIGRAQIAVTSGSYTLTADQASNQVMEISGTLAGNVTINVPAGPWLWFLSNSCTGAYTVTVKVAGQTGIVVSNGASVLAYVTSTDVISGAAYLPLVGGAVTGPIDEASAAPASATTLAIAAANFLQPTGNTTITALGTAQAGAERCIRFAGVLQLTDSANLILPGTNKNITTAADDVATFRSLGSGVWLLTGYKRGDGGLTLVGPLEASSVINEAMGANIAAAATTDLATATGNTVTITNTAGATSIASFGTLPAGVRRHLIFSITGGSVTLTYNASTMILPDAANRPMSHGDAAEFVSLGAGGWRMTNIHSGSSAARLWLYTTKTADYTISAATDYGKYFVFGASAPATAALPSAASALAGFVCGLRNNNTNSAKLTVTPYAGDVIEGVAAMDIGVGSSYILISDGVSKWYRMDTGISPSGAITFVIGSQVFGVGTATFTVPAGVYYIRVSLWSGGGAGGGGLTTGRAGGAGGTGAFATGVFAVIPGQTYTVTVGAGGISVTSGTAGSGGTSSFGALLSCTGGVGGVSGANGSGGSGGAGGTASGTGTLLNGNAGTSAGATNGWGSPGGSSAPGASGGGGVAALPIGTSGTAGASGSGGAGGGARDASGGLPGTAVSGVTRESGGAPGGGDGAGNLGFTGLTANNAGPGSSGSGAPGSASNAPCYGRNGADGKCIVEW